jgi:uncharacterized protein YecA (UPF0149 family)
VEEGYKYDIYIDPDVMGQKPPPVCVAPKPGRNDPCPCGKKDANGRNIKYKKCCGLT